MTTDQEGTPLQNIEESLAYTMAAWATTSGQTQGTRRTVDGLIDVAAQILDYLHLLETELGAVEYEQE